MGIALLAATWWLTSSVVETSTIEKPSGEIFPKEVSPVTKRPSAATEIKKAKVPEEVKQKKNADDPENENIDGLLERAAQPIVDEAEANDLLAQRKVSVMLVISSNPNVLSEFYGDTFLIMRGMHKRGEIEEGAWNELIANFLDNPATPKWILKDIESLGDAPKLIFPMEETGE